MIKVRLLCGLPILTAIFLSGCATKPVFLINVDSICDTSISIENRSYTLLPSKKDLDTDDLRYKLFAGYIHKGLSAQGYTPANSAEEAKIIIIIDYGIEEPKTHNYAYAAPIVKGTGGAMVAGSYTTFVRYLILQGIDAGEHRKSGKLKTLWKTTITSEGASDDLRLVLPYMIAASIPYISKDTGQKVLIQLKENDRAVLTLKGEPIDK